MKQLFWGIALSVLLAGSANAALVSRLSGQAYYDDVLNITWLANANLAETNTFGVTDINADGSMTWDKAIEWIAAMNGANYLGVSDWRLPTVVDTGAPGCDLAYTGTDCGYNVDLSTGEMAHLFYSTLGNLAYYDTWGDGPQVDWGLKNPGPFSNLGSGYFYWSGAPYAPDLGYAWGFSFYAGFQQHDPTTSYDRAWAVRPGDIVPVPAAVWLLGSALGVLGLMRGSRRPAHPCCGAA